MNFYQNATNNAVISANENAKNVSTQSIHLAVSPSGVEIPAFMFALGIISNGLAILFLLYFLFYGSSSPSWTTSHPPSRDHSMYELDVIDRRDRRPTATSIANVRVKVRTRHSVKFGPFHTLVLILAVLDFLSSLCTSPLTIILYVTNLRITYVGGKPLCFYSAFALLFFGFTTMAMVMTMSVERLLSIRHPYYYHRHANAKKALTVASIILILGALLCLLPVFGVGAIREMYPHSWCFSDWNATLEKDKVFNYLYVALGALMLIITVICNGIVIKGLAKMKKSMSGIHKTRRNTVSREGQMIIQLLVISIICVICWLPLLTRITANQSGAVRNPQQDRIALWLVAANPILDPWVYILCRKSVINGVIELVKRLPCFTLTTSKTQFPESPTPNRQQHLTTHVSSPRNHV